MLEAAKAGDSWESWKLEERNWCCDHFSVGCGTFDCAHEYQELEEKWSDEKKSFCCGKVGLGCPKAPETTTAVPQLSISRLEAGLKLLRRSSTVARSLAPGRMTGHLSSEAGFAWLCSLSSLLEANEVFRLVLQVRGQSLPALRLRLQAERVWELVRDEAELAAWPLKRP